MSKSEKIELWYDEQKQKHFAQYQKMLEDNKPDAEKIYKEKMTKLREIFQQKSYVALEEEKNKANTPPNPILTKIREFWSKTIKLFNEK